MIRYRAAWILPIAAPPIAGGSVAVDGGSISDVGSVAGGDVEDLGRVAVLPGLVNVHTHLELSWMQGQIAPDASMPAWAASLMALRRSVSAEPAAAIRGAIVAARRAGTCLVGDITNTLGAYEPLLESDLSAAVFRELLGFSPIDPDGIVASADAELLALRPAASLRPSIVPHAPYSVAPALFSSIARWHAAHDPALTGPVSVHLGESADEVAFLRDGSGAWRTLLESLGVWNPSWTPPGCGPVEYLDRFGMVGPRLVAVHGVQLTDRELTRLADARATLVACPRSNQWTGAGRPPIERFYASGVRVAVGTDSLASVADLNVFAEVHEMRRLAPRVPARRLLESATRSGADALGFGAELGTIEPGKRARLLAVAVPDGITDVEEYLVSGIEPSAIRWLDTA
ncbi:MAG: amidohydrolase family protein [Vicinamibacterales bacterium]